MRFFSQRLLSKIHFVLTCTIKGCTNCFADIFPLKTPIPQRYCEIFSTSVYYKQNNTKSIQPTASLDGIEGHLYQHAHLQQKHTNDT